MPHDHLQVFTIGHSTHPFDELIALLRSHHLTLVADVHTVPRSRLNPMARVQGSRVTYPKGFNEGRKIKSPFFQRGGVEEMLNRQKNDKAGHARPASKTVFS